MVLPSRRPDRRDPGLGQSSDPCRVQGGRDRRRPLRRPERQHQLGGGHAQGRARADDHLLRTAPLHPATHRALHACHHRQASALHALGSLRHGRDQGVQLRRPLEVFLRYPVADRPVLAHPAWLRSYCDSYLQRRRRLHDHARGRGHEGEYDRPLRARTQRWPATRGRVRVRPPDVPRLACHWMAVLPRQGPGRSS